MINKFFSLLKIFRTKSYLLKSRGKIKSGFGLHIGRRAFLWAPNYIDIGNNVYIGHEVTIACNTSIGNNCLLANRVACIGRNDHDFRTIGVPVRFGKWVGSASRSIGSVDCLNIGDDVWVGFGSIILSGINIEKGSIIAAGSVVTKNVSPYSIVAGVPAKVIGQRFSDKEAAEHEYRVAKGRFLFSECGYDKCIIDPFDGYYPGM